MTQLMQVVIVLMVKLREFVLLGESSEFSESYSYDFSPKDIYRYINIKTRGNIFNICAISFAMVVSARH